MCENIYQLYRLKDDGQGTFGTLKTGSDLYSSVERPYLSNKKMISSIPCEVYEIGYKKVLTPLTEVYRAKFSWFKWHIEIKNVPNRDSIYVHIANWPKDVHGCVGIGMGYGKDMITESAKAYEKFYRSFEPGVINIISL